MTYCYCCVYSQMIGIGLYKCVHDDVDLEDDIVSDVNTCFNYIYDDQFSEDECYFKYYLKDICYEKYCEC